MGHKHEFISVPGYCVEAKIPICPMCGDTKEVKRSKDQTITAIGPPRYVVECDHCLVKWEVRTLP